MFTLPLSIHNPESGPNRTQQSVLHSKNFCFHFICLLWRILFNILKIQSWTKSVQNHALSYSQETHPVNLAPWWPLPPPLPGQCCLVGSKNVLATLQHCFFWVGEGRGSILSELGFRGKYSKIRHTRCIFLNIFVQDCRWKYYDET